MMFHRQPRLPIDSELLSVSDVGEVDVDLFVERMVKVHNELQHQPILLRLNRIKKNIMIADILLR